MAFLRRVFGVIDALIREDNGMFEGGVSGSGGVLDFVGNGGVFGRNDVLIFRRGIIRTYKDVKRGLQAVQ
jgi:hypothetical protein